jgi:class 3 adenylate cyclase/TolB-like protein
MPSSQIERKLAAIMFTDIVGYTALSAKDSTKASKLLKTQRDTIKPIVEKHGGSWMKEIGDGLLLIFDSATSAVECSIAIQETTKDIEDLNLRIGIHEGEVIKQDGDVIGDDVNVASRIEPFSAVGGVAISHKIEQAISSNQEFETKYIGKPKLKGVAQEVKVYCITSHGLTETDVSKVSAKLDEEEVKPRFNIFALTGGILTAIGVAFWIAIGVFDVSFGCKKEVPSIAIIPFDNKGAEEDEFYAYSISSELISDVASAGLIRVAGLKDIEKLEFQTLNYSELSEKLLVRYIAQGTLWKVDSVFQLSMELYDTKTSKVLWSDSWQKAWNELASIKGNLAENILKRLKVSTKQDITRSPTNNAEAYEYYLKAKYAFERYEKLMDEEDLQITRDLVHPLTFHISQMHILP